MEKLPHNMVDCCVIGGGPAGMIAALYLKRFRRDVILIDDGNSRVAPVPKLRNLIGYHRGVAGKDLLAKIYKQVKKHKVPIVSGRAELRSGRAGFEIVCGKQKFTAKKIIIATGMSDVQPEVENFIELCRRGLLAYCPVCDAYDHRNEHIGILVNKGDCLQKIKFGFILVDQKQQTSREGIYAIGDCVESLSQISVGAGQAAIAATDIHNSLL